MPLIFLRPIIWIVRVICVSLPVVTIIQRCIGYQSSMKWKDQRYGMDGDSPVIGWGDPERCLIMVVNGEKR